ncbi:MAG: c-type cytochrome [Sulfurimonas sp.]|nr:c-type cytochrome [Sulfurimonas sp.]
MKTILALVVTLFFVACSDETSAQTQEEVSQSIEKIADVITEESTKITKSVTKATKESVETVTSKAEEVSKTVLVETQKVAQETATSIDEVLKKDMLLEKPKKVIEEEKVTIDAKALFAKCSSCHGVHADKKALNKSQSIRGWSVTQLTDAIKGYADGSYGGSMKGVMKPQVNKLSDDEIKAISEYISKL